MAELNSFESRVLTLLAQKIDLAIRVNADELARGNAKAGLSDINVTVQNYCETIGYVRALDNVKDWCKEIEDTVLGRQRKS